MPMHNPAHPGEVLRVLWLDEFGLSVTEAARHLGVSVERLSEFCAAESPLTGELAIRLERAFGSTAEAWMRMQAAWDLAQARRYADKLRVTPFRPAFASASD